LGINQRMNVEEQRDAPKGGSNRQKKILLKSDGGTDPMGLHEKSEGQKLVTDLRLITQTRMV